MDKNKLLLIPAVLVFFLFSVSSAEAGVIYTVQEGDSLWDISRKYDTRPETLTKINGITQTSLLLPGQSLIIPGQEYVIEEGGSLWKTAHLHQTTVPKLKEENNLSSDVVHPGKKLTIPRSPKERIHTGAFFQPGTPEENKWAMQFYRQYLSSVGFFEYRPDQNGQLSSLHGEHAIKQAWKQGMTPYATITNLTPEGFDASLAHTLLNSTAKREAFIENMASLVDQKQYKGVIIDFENLDPRDRSAFHSFIKALSARLGDIGGQVGLALPPMQGDGEPAYHGAYDYKALGADADFVFLMTYDWHWAGGEAGPIAPINKVERTIQYASSVMPSEKIYLGFAMYAYDWVVSSDQTKAEAYSQRQALKTAVQKSSEIQYNYYKATPFFRYHDKNGKQHEVWFEDARSLLPKYRLVKKYDLQGLGGWKTGLRFPQAGYLLKDEFIIE
ncbi:glycosyl hydrolase family 18 protein [Salibacterium halotolerans]|uniref:Spore germination protein YaaH n=1 Tax=Salibacterium halotolerans TaxID=1884432 RepID=A0A1I5Y7P2_9BACI|nr:glycosyl hydrolase family 18 protein [Salibacterium halotolerans]SFQ40204.1 Spore germination protein YaaH [Salibacterium halotolerans]